MLLHSLAHSMVVVTLTIEAWALLLASLLLVSLAVATYLRTGSPSALYVGFPGCMSFGARRWIVTQLLRAASAPIWLPTTGDESTCDAAVESG